MARVQYINPIQHILLIQLFWVYKKSYTRKWCITHKLLFIHLSLIKRILGILKECAKFDVAIYAEPLLFQCHCFGIMGADLLQIVPILGVVHKLRLQDKVGRWSKNVHFLSTFIPQKMSTEEGRWLKKAKILSTQFVNDPLRMPAEIKYYDCVHQ